MWLPRWPPRGRGTGGRGDEGGCFPRELSPGLQVAPSRLVFPGGNREPSGGSSKVLSYQLRTSLKLV